VPELLVRRAPHAAGLRYRPYPDVFPAGQTWCFLRAGCASSCTAAFGIAAHMPALRARGEKQHRILVCETRPQQSA
jgi:hypothetical protein